MSNEVFPTLPGLTWNIDREDEWRKSVKDSDSGRSFSRAMWTYPVRHYRLEFEFLRAGAEAELQQLVGFFNRHKGDFDTWLFDDPLDNEAVNQQFATGTGAQAAFQLVRSFGGHQAPVFSVNGTPEIYRQSGGWRGNELLSPVAYGNAFPYSDSLGNWTSYVGAVVFGADNTVTAPDGTLTADTMTEDTSNGAHFADRYNNFGAAGTLTISAYFSSAVGSRGGLLGMYSTDNTHEATYNLITGVATMRTPQAGESAGMVDVGGGWWRCWLTANITNTGGPIQRVGLCRYDGSTVYTGDTGAIYTWGRQLNRGGLLPYVATANAAVNVAADYTLSDTGKVTLREALAAGALLRWYGKFYQRCRFKSGRFGYKQFMEHLFSAKSVDFKTIKP